jgi:hypothetical protein
MRADLFLAKYFGYSIEEISFEILYRIPPNIGDNILRVILFLVYKVLIN